MIVSSHYNGPIGTLEVDFAGSLIRVAIPADLDRVLDDPEIVELNARDGSMPYWAQLWPGAYLLAESICALDRLPGSIALEIGCGLGLAGLAALTKGIRVVFTDRDHTALEFVAQSARLNGFDDYELALLDWRAPLDEATYPWILGADVLYEREHVALIGNLLARLLDRDGEAWLAGPYRAACEEFDANANEFGLRVEKRNVAAKTETGRALEGTLRIVSRRS